MTLNQELLTEIVPIVAKKLEAWSAETGAFVSGDYSTWVTRCLTANDRIIEFFSARYDARFTGKGSDYAVTMAGIRSTSTGGWTGALRNWQRAAENKLAASAGTVHRDGFNPHGSGPVPIEPREG